MNIEQVKPLRGIAIDAILGTASRYQPTNWSKTKEARWAARDITLLRFLKDLNLTSSQLSAKTDIADRRVISKVLRDLEDKGRVKRASHHAPFEITKLGRDYLSTLERNANSNN